MGTTDRSELKLKRLPPPPSLDELVYKSLKDAIVSHELEGGTMLLEADLATQLNVSKTPVRSALQRLEALGFVERLPYAGTRVTECSLDYVRNVYLVRSVLEGLAVRLGTPEYSAADIEQMKSVLATEKNALVDGDSLKAAQLGRQWHDLLRQPLRNQFLDQMLDVLADHVERGRALTSANRSSALQSVEEHFLIVEAIEARNAELAEKRMREHLARVVDSFASPDGLEGDGKAAVATKKQGLSVDGNSSGERRRKRF